VTLARPALRNLAPHTMVAEMDAHEEEALKDWLTRPPG
jgi:hypothetical protein